MANKKGGKNGRELYRNDFTLCYWSYYDMLVCSNPITHLYNRVSALGLIWLASDLAPPEVYSTIIHGICKKKKSISSISKANYGFFPPQSVRVIIILHNGKREVIADASRVDFIAWLNEVPSFPPHQLAAIRWHGMV